MDITVVPQTVEPTVDIGGLRTSDRPERLLGLLVLLVGLGGFFVWAAVAPIDSATVAAGTLTVESTRKTVQHLEGGIVSQILVREGERVPQDAVLVRLDDTEARAQLEIVRSRFLARRAEEARLVAERDGARTVAFPADLTAAAQDPRVEEAVTGQQRVFQARYEALAGESDVLQQRVEQLGEQIKGLEAVAKSKQKRIGLYQEELTGLNKLFEKGMGDKSKLREWERMVAELEGERAEHQASIASARVQIGETKLRMAQVRQRFASEVAAQLRTVQTDLSDLRERTRALENTLERTLVRAPVGGAVVGMKVHTVGGVVRAGEAILDIIPQGEALIIEARVQPNDIDRVTTGQPAQVRFSAFNARTTPTVPGVVQTVSADSLTDARTGAPYYLARIQVTDADMASLHGLTLQPGMPADVIIKNGERTFFQYLIRPLMDRVALGLKED